MKLKTTVMASVIMLAAATSSLALVEKPAQEQGANAQVEALALQLEASVPRSAPLSRPL